MAHSDVESFIADLEHVALWPVLAPDLFVVERYQQVIRLQLAQLGHRRRE